MCRRREKSCELLDRNCCRGGPGPQKGQGAEHQMVGEWQEVRHRKLLWEKAASVEEVVSGTYLRTEAQVQGKV